MDEEGTALLSDIDNPDKTNSSKTKKKKSKTLNRLRKLKKTNGTISPSSGLLPRPPDDADKNSLNDSISNLAKHKEQNVTNGDIANNFTKNDNETSTPLKVNSAFVANVYFGGSPHRPSPPPKITDGKNDIADKPRPVPRRRIKTPPISEEDKLIEKSETRIENSIPEPEFGSILPEDQPDVPSSRRKSTSTLDIREGLPSNKPVPPPPRKEESLSGDLHNSEKIDQLKTECNNKPVFVFDPATGEMVVKKTCKDKTKTSLPVVDLEDSSSEDDLVIPVRKPKPKTSESHLQNGLHAQEQKDTKRTSSNISQSIMPLKTSTPLRSVHQENKSLLTNDGKKEDTESDDDVIIVNLGQKNKKRTTSLPPVGTSETVNIVQKQDGIPFITSSSLPVKEVRETKSEIFIRPRTVPLQEQDIPSQESGVESDRSSTVDDESSQPGTSSMNDKLPPIYPKQTLPALSQNSYRTPFKVDEQQHSKIVERSGSLPFSEPVVGADDTMSMTNRSFMSTGALPTITTKALKNRSYLSGGLQATNSLLGREELERYFPDRQLKIFMATWNMHNEKDIPSNLEDLLLPDDTVFVQDIYAIGTQESCPEKQEWEVNIQQILGPTHVLLHSANHGVLNLLIFIRRDLIWFCSPIEEDRVSTRVGSMIKTKGAMAVAFNFFGTSLLFIASHFTSGDEKLKERVLDYEKIITTLQLPVKDSPIRPYNKSSTDVTAKFDCVFWCGDFNFRIDLPKERVEKWITNMKKKDEPNFNKLLKEDQLIKEMKRKEVFKHFKEDEIRFFPTYKFDLTTDEYDTSVKARVPSYTDRILYRSRKKDDVTAHVYNCCETIKISDHRPVYAIFSAKIRPGRHDMPTGGGQFARNVFVEGNKRRAEALRNEKTSSVCVIL